MGFRVYGMLVTKDASHLKDGQDKRNPKTHILRTEQGSQHSPQDTVDVRQVLVYFHPLCGLEAQCDSLVKTWEAK